MISIRPTRAAVLAHAGPQTHVALSTTLVVDGETPISLFRKVAGATDDAFLLESVEGGELMGRYSFLGTGATGSLRYAGGVATVTDETGVVSTPCADPLVALGDWLARWDVLADPGLPRFTGGAVGFLGFDCAARFEPVPLPAAAADDLPEAHLLFTESLCIYDHVARRVICVVHARLDGDRAAAWDAAAARLAALVEVVLAPVAPEPGFPLVPVDPATLPLRATRTPADYEAAVRTAQAAIAAGEVFQVVPSQRFIVDAAVDPLELYRSLRALNPSPYMFLLRFADHAVVGASPEVLVRVEGDDVLVRPIAGTRPRGATPAADAALAAELAADPKELAEHRMLVDLGRNDVGRVCRYGSVRVEAPLHIERYAHVMHLVTDVRGTLRPGQTALDAFRACFPAGTVSGAPRIRACELLADLEPHRRGLYAGAVGYFDFAGNLDTCIAIRTLVVEPGRVHVQAGAGVVFDSVPAAEEAECRHKARSALTAIALTLARAGTP